jgi:CheY-like chemotaxis protein
MRCSASSSKSGNEKVSGRDIQLEVFPAVPPGFDQLNPSALRDQATKFKSKKPESPCSILLVEDHHDTAAVLSRALKRKGFRVGTVNTVADAIRMFEAERFDLLISDIGLPDGSGIELLIRLNAVRRIPAIALSGYGMERDLEKSRVAGFIEHLIKPVNLDALCDSIARALISNR